MRPFEKWPGSCHRNGIIYERDKAILRIPYKKEATAGSIFAKRVFFFRLITTPIVRCFLNVYNVTEYYAEDQQRVDEYDFNEIKYDAKEGSIIVLTGIPTAIKISVTAFHISIDETDDVVGSTKKLTVF